ncbi:hypothetical protein DDV21_003875 [Streptococcus chenjunshii]|uniref:Uncharacterized protein n=1 Tax=Streptococcus chenjunshii TaxID=2173853 RepID=A0A372KKS5_9STRE|nr:hypothetical protein [Streptococcus chenjunshii]AXQ78277.1 hypothetical protein DDV21_003875 [Streptococcus chenjunshii]RFU50724.1 hypothetical protein DDV22_07135 [Streptococcus chenjunshii]RFU52875.1 hypothetical protein DDV23_07510 [Streptococcus chenjunshii]
MGKLKFNGVMNAAVSLALSCVTLLLLKQGPDWSNFILPTAEGFVIAMFLTTVFPLERWGRSAAKKVSLPQMTGTLILTAFVNVTCITFILTFQQQPLTVGQLQLWAKTLPVFYLTAVTVSSLVAKVYLKGKS